MANNPDISSMQTQLLQSADLLKRSQRLVVLTGAGISKESGVPTFRDGLDGLWAQFDPAQLATPDGFRKNPKLVWDWYASRREKIEAVTPNAAHYALAELQTLLPQVVIVTQNIDSLHQLAGSRDVITLHGDIRQYKCSADCQGSPTQVEVTEWNHLAEVPRCPHCGELVRPNIVWFNEFLPSDALERARDLSKVADVMLIVGTAGVVEPAASLPYHAKRYGEASVIDINPAEDELTVLADVFLQAPAGLALPRLVELIRA